MVPVFRILTMTCLGVHLLSFVSEKWKSLTSESFSLIIYSIISSLLFLKLLFCKCQVSCLR